MTNTQVPALHAAGLTKRYPRKLALNECDVSVARGRMVGLVGPNGAGKSTLLQLVCGLISPTSGQLTVMGQVPRSDSEHLARVGFVAQDTPVYPRLTVAEHLMMGRRLNPRWDAQLATSRTAEVGLDPQQRAGSLSGGQRAQLALALAVAKRPELLILDEPAAALDPLARRGFMEGLRDFTTAIDATTILSSHLLEDVEEFCDFLIVLAGGTVRIHGSTQALTSTHRLLPDSSAHVEMTGSLHEIASIPGGRLVRLDNLTSAPPGTDATAGQVAFAYLVAATGGGAR